MAMTDREATLEKVIEVKLDWTDVFKAANKLLAETQPSDVRWVHVERARKLYESIKTLFEQKDTSSPSEEASQ